MKLLKTLLATTTLTLAAASTFAASGHEKAHTTQATQEKVIVSTQELPETTQGQAATTDASPAASAPTTN